MRCHTGPEKQRGSSALRAYASLRKHTRAAKHLVATCCTNATETRSAHTGAEPHRGGTSQPQKRSGFEYARTTERRMIARSCQPEQSQNILPFRRDLSFVALKFAPTCAQCRLRMAIMRAEPDLNAREFRITYRCLE